MTPDPETKRVRHWLLSVTAIAFLVFLVMVQLSSIASATDISNLDSDIGTALGVGDVAGGLIILVAVVMCADLLLGVVGASFQVMLFIDLMLTGVLTAIGWADVGIFIVALIVIAAFFSPSLVKIFWPSGGE